MWRDRGKNEIYAGIEIKLRENTLSLKLPLLFLSYVSVLQRSVVF